ncbi:UNVERIFIED_CONTAM: hypothetical protein FKN15_007157 [Acipenser sinensis]
MSALAVKEAELEVAMGGMGGRPGCRVRDRVRQDTTVREAGRGEDGLGREDVMWRHVQTKPGTHVIDLRDVNNGGGTGASPGRPPAMETTTGHSMLGPEAKVHAVLQGTDASAAPNEPIKREVVQSQALNWDTTAPYPQPGSSHGAPRVKVGKFNGTAATLPQKDITSFYVSREGYNILDRLGVTHSGERPCAVGQRLKDPDVCMSQQIMEFICCTRFNCGFADTSPLSSSRLFISQSATLTDPEGRRES